MRRLSPLWWVAGGLAAIPLALYALAVLLGVAEGEWVQDAVARSSAGGAVALALLLWVLLVLDVLLPIPATVVMTMSGGLLGFWPGAAVNAAGGLCAALLGFLACRRLGRAAFSKMLGRREDPGEAGRVERWLRDDLEAALVLTRGVPILAEVSAGLAGLGTMRLRRFLGLVSCGVVPVALLYAAAGVGAATVEGGLGWVAWGVASFLVPAALYGGYRVFRLWRGRRGPRGTSP